MSYFDKATELYKMIYEGNIMEAFEKFYAENVVMIEATGDVREGKDKNREFEQQFFSTVKEVHGGGIYNITSNEETGVTMVESWMDSTFNDGNRMKMEEVAIQTWEGDQIIRERFYYHMPGQE
jgi:ketosteroid isomerase-like protein